MPFEREKGSACYCEFPSRTIEMLFLDVIENAYTIEEEREFYAITQEREKSLDSDPSEY